MAVFGAPLDQADHADRGVDAAVEMLARMRTFNAWMQQEGHGDGFKMGIGLNSGPVMSGHVGSERRLEYTAIGDTTNTAARLEGMTKGEALPREPLGGDLRRRHRRLVRPTQRERDQRGELLDLPPVVADGPEPLGREGDVVRRDVLHGGDCVLSARQDRGSGGIASVDSRLPIPVIRRTSAMIERTW